MNTVFDVPAAMLWARAESMTFVESESNKNNILVLEVYGDGWANK